LALFGTTEVVPFLDRFKGFSARLNSLLKKSLRRSGRKARG